MATEIKVSVIVPVYNVENYLRQCLDSIANQTLKEIEIICVDDGSTDSSLEILKEYEAQDERFQILVQQNQYAGVARNNGMAAASGKYLIFWDSDDFFHPDALEKLYTQIEADEADICICGAGRYYEDLDAEAPFPGYLKEELLPETIPFSMDDMPEYFLNFTCEAAWNKLFRKSFVEEKGLAFHPVRNGNDLFFVILGMCQAERITVVRESLISYRRNRTGSLIHTTNKSALTVYKEWLQVKDALQAIGRFPEKSYHNKVLSNAIYLLDLSHSVPEFNEKLNWLKQEGFAAFGLTEREEGYYRIAWQEECLKVLLSEENETCLMWLMARHFAALNLEQSKLQITRKKYNTTKEKLAETREERKELREQLKKANAELEYIKNSRTYKFAQKLQKLAGKKKEQ